MSHMLLIPFITWLLWFLSIKRSNGVLLKAFQCFLIFAFKSQSCWNLLASTHISLPVRWDGRRKLINKLDLAVFFWQFKHSHTSDPWYQPAGYSDPRDNGWFTWFSSLLDSSKVVSGVLGIFICRTTTEQSSNPSSSSEQNLTGSVHDLNIISQRRAGEETLSFLHIYGLTASPALRLLISQEENNARGFLDFLVSLLMQFCLSEEH